jgi:hypothetical protein
MPQFFYLDSRQNTRQELRFDEFISLTEGCSIKSMASGDGFIEIGVTGDMNLRFEGRGPDVTVSVVSTLNADDIPSIRLQLSDESGPPSAMSVETQLHSLRQLHALAVLALNERLPEAARELASDENVDLERLIDEDDRLFLSSASEGSFWMTLVTKTKDAFVSVHAAIPLFFKESRQHVIESARAVKDGAHLDNDKKRLDLQYDEMNKAIDLLERVQSMQDPTAKAVVVKMLARNMGNGAEETLAPLLVSHKPTDDEEKSKRIEGFETN